MKPCLDSLHKVYGRSSQMSEYFYYSPEQDSVTFTGEIDGEKVRFVSEFGEPDPQVIFIMRNNRVRHRVPKAMLWKEVNSRVTRALDHLPRHYAKHSSFDRSDYEAAMNRCEPFYKGELKASLERLRDAFARVDVANTMGGQISDGPDAKSVPPAHNEQNAQPKKSSSGVPSKVSGS